MSAKDVRLLSLLVLIGAACAPEAPPPNVLLIIADDLGVDQVAAYGVSPAPPPTPTLDALAAEGVLFRWAYADPVCSPTRMGMLTGRYGFRTGIGSGVGWGAFVGGRRHFQASLDEVALPEILASTHRTAAVGKWHLATAQDGGYQHPVDTGFDVFRGAKQNLGGPDTPDPQRAYFEWEKNVADASGNRQSTCTTYATTENVDDALALIESFGDEPWFVWLAFNAPHTPFHRPPDHLHTRDFGALETGTETDPTQPREPTEAEELLMYQAMVEALDGEIGRLLAGLDPAVRGRTTVIFIGDNGTPSQVVSRPVKKRRAKGTVYEAGVRVPLIVAGAGVTGAGREVDALVNSVDMFATILDLCGAADPGTGVDSRSFRNHLADPAAPPERAWVHSALRSPNGFEPHSEWSRMVRGPRYKLCRQSWRAEGFPPSAQQFYDLEADPWERKNLLPRLTAAQQRAYHELDAVLETLGPW